MELSKKHIDEQIKKRLENLESNYDPSTWNGLANRLEFEEQEIVDGLFKDRVGNISPTLVPGSWEAMEKLIDANEAVDMIENEADIDNTAYDKLNNLRVPYNDHHWALMAKRLEEEFSIRHILYRYKVAEITLMGLLLLTIIRFLPLMENWTNSSSNQPPIIEQTIDAPSAEQAIPQIAPTDDQQEQFVTGSPIASLSNTNENNANALSNIQLLPSIQNEISNLSGSNIFQNLNKERNWSRLNFLPNIVASKLEINSGADEILEAFDEKQEKLLVAENNRVDDINTLAFSASPINSDFSWELPTVAINPEKKDSDLRFSIFTTTDLNYVTTPPSQISVFGESVKTDYNETMASGYGGGVTVSWKRGRWEYQTGGIYSFKRYIPNTPIFIFETINFYIKEDFNGIELDILQVPLNASYHFKNTGKWRFYSTAGISGHFVTSTLYEIDHEKQALNLIPPTESSPDDLKSISNQIEFTDGLVDGGNFRENFYMSANIGLGVERYLSPKWTIFFQPNYQHFLMSNGIGTNMDKIYTTSIHLGTKFNLK